MAITTGCRCRQKKDLIGLMMKDLIAQHYHQLGYFFSNITRLNRIVNFSDIKMGNPQAQKNEAMLTIAFKASTFSAVKEEDKEDKGGKKGK